MKVTTTTYGGTKNILYFPDNHIAIPVTITNTGVDAGVDGRKVIRAGAIIGAGDGTVGTLSDAALPVKVCNTKDAEGVLLDDVDVTDEARPATMVISGFVNLDKIPEAPAPAAKTALKKITFMRMKNA